MNIGNNTTVKVIELIATMSLGIVGASLIYSGFVVNVGRGIRKQLAYKIKKRYK